LVEKPVQIRFGVFIVDTDTRELLRRGEPMPLSPKSFQLLQVLLEERPRVLSKQELIERVWPDVAVEEENVKARIREIRTLLADDDSPAEWIRTAHGFGYGFKGEAADDSDADQRPPGNLWWLLHGTKSIVIQRGESYVGRDPRCEVFIDDDTVSRKHARVVVSDTGLMLKDLDSTNGTFIGDVPLSGRTAEIKDNDSVRFGSVTLTFRSTPPHATTRKPTPDGKS
jgi:DNA-binding winged helix-turn-helix (wHTH) protein